jgi:hypothetical protein
MRWVPGASAHWEESSPRAQAQQAGKPPDAKPAVPAPESGKAIVKLRTGWAQVRWSRAVS